MRSRKCNEIPQMLQRNGKRSQTHPQLDTPPPDTFVRLACMETGVDLLYNKFGISVQGQLVADRDHVARVFGDKCMGIHLFLHVGAKGWLGFAPQSILLVGTCLDGELAMETQQSLVIVDYTERMEFDFLSDQTAERCERANAANSNFRRQLNRHTRRRKKRKRSRRWKQRWRAPPEPCLGNKSASRWTS